MGYTIVIGEAQFDGCKDDAYLRVTARREAHDSAPTFDNDTMTGSGNDRSPSYTGWSQFCREVGLYGMFFGVDGRRDPYMKPDPNSHRDSPIMQDHPGFAAINEEDVLAVRHALDRHVLCHGELIPGFRAWDERDEDAPVNANECAARARLIWLVYWMEWAVENCQHPIIANS